MLGESTSYARYARRTGVGQMPYMRADPNSGMAPLKDDDTGETTMAIDIAKRASLGLEIEIAYASATREQVKGETCADISWAGRLASCAGASDWTRYPIREA